MCYHIHVALAARLTHSILPPTPRLCAVKMIGSANSDTFFVAMQRIVRYKQSPSRIIFNTRNTD